MLTLARFHAWSGIVPVGMSVCSLLILTQGLASAETPRPLDRSANTGSSSADDTQPFFVVNLEHDLVVAATVLVFTLIPALFFYARAKRRKNKILIAQREALRISENRLLVERKLFEDVERMSQTGGWQLDLATNELTWSAETKRIHDVPADYEPTVEEAINFYAPEDRPRIRAAVEAGIQDRTGWDMELSLITAKGRSIYVRAMGEVVYLDGKPAVLLGAFQDITERKLAVEATRLAHFEAERANKAKSSFLAAMSHEFRTPLNAILGFSDVIRQELFGVMKPEAYLQYANDIHSSGEHLLSLVNEILDISAIEAGKQELKKEHLDTPELIRQSITYVSGDAERKQVEITFASDFAHSELYADKRAIRQILLNLLSNAIKFTPEGGKIDVTVTVNDETTTILVRDTGVGIPPDELDRIVEPFTRGHKNPHTASDGWGLGLAISQSLAILHRGQLKIESEPGAGTSARLILPNQEFDQSPVSNQAIL